MNTISIVDLTDEEFLHAFEQCVIPPDQFHHKEHIRMAWLYLRTYSLTQAADLVVAGIKRFADSKQLGTLYHDTITRFWIHAVARSLERVPQATNFIDFAAENPFLFDSNWIQEFYSKELLFSAPAREQWVAPDRKDL